MARAKKKAGDINSSSMADIAFLLLIFFLVTTTMDVDTGMKRTLPPWIDPTEQQNDGDVNERNVLKVNVSRSGAIMVVPMSIVLTTCVVLVSTHVSLARFITSW